MIKGDLLAKGRTAEVYLWGDDQVLKLFYDWCPPPWVERETKIAEAISQTDIPAPKCFGPVIVDGRQGIVFQRIQGFSLLKLMTSNPLHIAQYARLMADLQSQIHRQDGSALPPLRDWLRKDIQEAKPLSRTLRDFACRVLEDLPDGHALCHFDFHPDQIMMTAQGPMVLDWMTAFQGDPRADVARTSVILTMGSAAHMGWVTRTLVGVARRQVHRSYLKQYIGHNKGTDLITIRKWMIPIGAARLNEEIGEEEGTIVRFLDDAFKQKRSA